MNSPAECAAIAAILGGKAFVRVADGEDALFVSDAPRRLPPHAWDIARLRLENAGYTAQSTENGLLAVDWDEARWRLWRDACADAEPAAFPGDKTLWPAYALAALLARHPAPWETQPRELLRAAVKATFTPSLIPQTAKVMYGICAQRLRLGLPLPSAAAGAFWNHIRLLGGALKA